MHRKTMLLLREFNEVFVGICEKYGINILSSPYSPCLSAPAFPARDIKELAVRDKIILVAPDQVY